MTSDGILHKIRSLLAKAESTDFEEEALALTAKAHELMIAHAIDRALLDDSTGSDEVIARVVTLEAPYARQKFLLLDAAGRASGCRAVLGLSLDEARTRAVRGELGDIGSGLWATLVGHPADLDDAELLFTSLGLQVTRLMLSAEATPGRVKSFRRAFIIGFADSVRRRVEANRERAVSEHDDAASLLPVLASREQAVEAAVNERFESLGRLKMSLSNGEGLAAGRSAGQRADLGARPLRQRRSLPSG